MRLAAFGFPSKILIGQIVFHKIYPLIIYRCFVGKYYSHFVYKKQGINRFAQLLDNGPGESAVHENGDGVKIARFAFFEYLTEIAEITEFRFFLFCASRN